MTERMKFKLQSWDAGRRFMKDLATVVGGIPTEEDALLYVRTASLTASCFFDEREFAFIKIKLDAEIKEKLGELLSKYKLT